MPKSKSQRKINQKDQENFEVRDLRGKERFVLDNEFFNGYVRLLGVNTLAVYCSLARHADRHQSCYPSIQKMSHELSLSKPTVIGCIAILEYFRIILKKRIGRRCNNRYDLLNKKYWRKDWQVMLTELTSQSGGEVKLVNFSGKRRLLHWLTTFTSNSKETHSKETHSKGTFLKKSFESANSNQEIRKALEAEKRKLEKKLGFKFKDID